MGKLRNNYILLEQFSIIVFRYIHIIDTVMLDNSPPWQAFPVAAANFSGPDLLSLVVMLVLLILYR